MRCMVRWGRSHLPVGPLSLLATVCLSGEVVSGEFVNSELVKYEEQLKNGIQKS